MRVHANRAFARAITEGNSPEVDMEFGKRIFL
jgi:hypothetical protein